MTWLLANPVTRALGAALMAVLAVLTFGAIKKREGRREAQREAERKDHAKANEVRRRVSAVERVSDDALKFRD